MRSTLVRRVSSVAVLLSLILVGILSVSCTPRETPVQTPPPLEGESGSGQDEGQDEQTTRPEEEPLHVSQVKVNGDETAVITTNKGVIEFEFYPKDAPNTVASFIELSDKGFYDGIKWHRYEPGFVIQGGDPLTKDPSADPRSWGTGGPGYSLKAEFNSRKHLEGTVAMARSQNPDSAGSQFYICLAPAAFLDGNYTVFGQVTKGMDVVQQLRAGDVIESIKIDRGGK